MRYVVNVHGVFLRKEPKKEKGNERAVLPEGTEVEVLDRSGKWWRVSGAMKGIDFEGWVSSRYLEPKSNVRFDSAFTLIPVHYRENNPGVRRSGRAGASPLGEPGMPRSQVKSPEELDAIIDWLGVEKHKRYLPSRGLTFCNIYAYDVAYAAGVYLPRVWWTDDSIAALEAGKRVEAKYNNTIVEVRANRLHDWLIEYGPRFGWKRTLSLTDLQECADRGGIATICARRKGGIGSGHIVIVAPHTASIKARTDSSGRVTMPVQSQAGLQNFRRSVPKRAWWSDTRFESFVLFTHG